MLDSTSNDDVALHGTTYPANSSWCTFEFHLMVQILVLTPHLYFYTKPPSPILNIPLICTYYASLYFQYILLIILRYPNTCSMKTYHRAPTFCDLSFLRIKYGIYANYVKYMDSNKICHETHFELSCNG